MAFGTATAYDRLAVADLRREPLTLDAEEVADLLADLPDEDNAIAYSDIASRLREVDVKALKVPVKARQAIAEALGLDAEDLWR